MFNRIVVGVKGRDSDRDAIALARQLKSPQGELMLAHVYYGDDTLARGAGPLFNDPERARGQDILKGAQAAGDVQARLCCHGSATVGRGLHEIVESHEADLLVIGSSRHGLLHRVLLSDTLNHALDGAPCAVAIAPAGYAERARPLQSIGVGYDGSPDSTHALEIARALARETGARLSGFQAVNLPTPLAGGRAAVDGTPLTELVRRARERIMQLGGVEAHAGYGEPAEELAVYSGAVDLLIVGSRGYGPLGRLVHGSTARRLARSAHSPLLILTRPARRREPGVATVPEEAGTAAPAARA